MKPIRLKVKLSLAFLTMTLIVVAAISLLANYFLVSQFKSYAISKQNQSISDLVSLLSSRYADWGSQWDDAGLENIGVKALADGYLLRIRDDSGAVLWDAQMHNEGMCTAMLAGISTRMQAQYQDFQGGYVEETYSVNLNGNLVGSVDIGYYGPYFYSDLDIKFLNALNRLLLVAAMIALIISLLFGFVFAGQLTRPITRVINATQEIAEGRYADRVREKSSTTEIAELTASVNSLADTLGQQEDLRRRLTSDVAHELRTPIAILQSHLEAMIDGVWAADSAHLQSCYDEAIRMSKLVGDLEKLTVIEQGSLVLDRKPIDLGQLLQHVASSFQPEFTRKQISLTLSTSEETITADYDKLSQVFVNLVANALRYTDSGGRVEIRTWSDSRSVSVEVADTGIGIDQSELPYIFERFYRTDLSRNRQTGGSGIGLTIAKTIIEAHQGRIAVSSQPGQGSRFTVTLPRDLKST